PKDGTIKIKCDPAPNSICYKLITYDNRQMDNNEIIIEVFQNGLKINEFFTTDFKKNINSIEFKVED
ncbi:MAG: hypothetical protein SFU27_00345, partial [Thermonemataceae bacterium]|nr:hypothetical protein [Thermonemataceae bacterium]